MAIGADTVLPKMRYMPFRSIAVRTLIEMTLKVDLISSFPRSADPYPIREEFIYLVCRYRTCDRTCGELYLSPFDISGQPTVRTDRRIRRISIVQEGSAFGFVVTHSRNHLLPLHILHASRNIWYLSCITPVPAQKGHTEK